MRRGDKRDAHGEIGVMHTHGVNHCLYHFAAEIHMIKCVKENPNRHMTALAEVLGVTRGAVSQIAMKLEGKGMLIKERDEGSSLRRILRVTPEGERAYLFHERLHAEFDRLVEGLLADASERDRDFLRNFLGALDAALERGSRMCGRINQRGGWRDDGGCAGFSR